MQRNQKGFSAVEGLLIVLVLVVVGFGGYYVWSKQKAKKTIQQSSASNTQTPVEEGVEVTETSTETTYQSKLYPSLSFTVPAGWRVEEPKAYDESTWGPGSADSKINIIKADSTLTLDFSTIRATGFEGYTCYKYANLKQVKEYTYRFTDKEGLTQYRNGVSEANEDWTDSSTGEYSHSEDANPNYCVAFPYIATHESTLNKSDYPDSIFNSVSTDKDEVTAWVSADLKGSETNEVLADTDKIIKSFSDSVEW